MTAEGLIQDDVNLNESDSDIADGLLNDRADLIGYGSCWKRFRHLWIDNSIEQRDFSYQHRCPELGDC